MGKWADFKLKTEKLPVSDYMKVHIALDTAYKWGSGWDSQEANEKYGSYQMAAKAWRDEVYGKLETAGFVIEEPKHSSSCAILHENQFFERRESMNLYMHPMDFSGYATQAQIDTVVDILKDCETVNSVEIRIATPTYNLSDYSYEDILKSNAKNIIQHICEHYKPKERYSDEIAFDFAEEVRLPRAGQKDSGISSDDVDVKYIKQLCDFAKEFNIYETFDKKIKKEKDHECEKI